MALPLTGITTTVVKQAIGLGSDDVGQLCIRAASGGIMTTTEPSNYNSAFMVSENGGGVNDGALISSAKPFWNIWSDESPGEWQLPGNFGEPVWFRLKRGYDNTRYAFRLGTFRGYDHRAMEPTPFGFLRTFTKGAAGSSTTFDAALKIKLGSYNWGKLSGVSHCRCLTYDSNNNLISSSVALPINTTNQFITFENVQFTVSTASIASYTWTSKIALCNSTGDILGVLPITGIATVEIVAAIVNTLSVNVAGNPKVFSVGSTLIGGGSIYASGNFNSMFGISANGRVLNSITYIVRNASDNSVVSQTTVTTFNAYEYPTILDIYLNGEGETFYASYGNGRPSPGANQYLQVMMEYV